LQIDWFTVAAQIVNFLVLVWLLKRFLYKPITSAMRRREERIETRLSEAQEARQQAEDKARELDQRNAELDRSKDEILQSARDEAADLRDRLKQEIRDEMEQDRAAWRGHLAEERDDFLRALRQQAASRVLDMGRDLLSEYGGGDLTAQSVERFVDRLATLEGDELDKLQEAAAEKQAIALVHSAAELDGPTKGKITRALHKTVCADMDVRYEVAPDLLLGACLTIGDYRVEWSASRHLERLEADMAEIIDTEARAEAHEETGNEDAPGEKEQAGA